MARAKTLDEVRLFLDNKNIILLSDNYVNSNSLIFVMCQSGHSWETTFNNLRSGGWCPICYKISRSK